MATSVTVARRIAGLAAAMALFGAPALVGGALAHADDACPFRVATPPAVDSSEVPQAGDPPEPLPVPGKPVGGDALSVCGIITAPGTPPLPDDVSADAW